MPAIGYVKAGKEFRKLIGQFFLLLYKHSLLCVLCSMLSAFVCSADTPGPSLVVLFATPRHRKREHVGTIPK